MWELQCVYTVQLFRMMNELSKWYLSAETVLAPSFPA